MFYKWLSLGGRLSDLNHSQQWRALELAIIQKNGPLIFSLLSAKVLPTEEELVRSDPSVVAFFNYKPGKTSSFLSFKALLNSPLTTSEQIQRYLIDQQEDSGEDSSDEEVDTFQRVNADAMSNRQLLARGIHYSPSYFPSAKKRNDYKQPNAHNKTIYSRATEDLAEKTATHLPGNPTLRVKRYEHADQLVKGYFELLKLTPDKREFKADYKKRDRQIQGEKAEFRSLYYRFVHAYVNPNGYHDLFVKGGMSRNFNFYCDYNPTLSMTPTFEVACRYASGERINHSVRYYPKVQLSTGQLKHRRLGYVEVYAIDAEYFAKHATDIDALNRRGEISIASNYSHNQEIIVESSIPDKFVLGFQLFSLPSMKSTWSIRILDVYGLTQVEYESFRNRLKLVNCQAEAQPILQDLIFKVTARQAQNLEQQIRRLLWQPPALSLGSNSSSTAEVDALSTNFAGMGMGTETTLSTSTSSSSTQQTASLSHLNANNPHLVTPLPSDSSKAAFSLPGASSTKAPPADTIISETASHPASVFATVSTVPHNLTVGISTSNSSLSSTSTSTSLLNQLGVSVGSLPANPISSQENSLSSTSAASLATPVTQTPSVENTQGVSNPLTASLLPSSNLPVIKPPAPS